MDKLVKHYENCFHKHGDTPQGVDWPNKQDAETRYQVMLQGIDTMGSDDSGWVV